MNNSAQLSIERLARMMSPPPLEERLFYIQGTSPAVLEWFRPFADTLLANHVNVDPTFLHLDVLLTVCSWAKPYSNS